jgi:diguanylate cyclase (GGDEF)-like protein
MAKKSITPSPSPRQRRDGSDLPRSEPGNPALPEPKRAKPDPKLLAQSDAALAIRRLRRQLAAAHARIEQLQASADTDFLLDVLNRRGFERELTRAMAYIGRYGAAGALIVLDIDRLKPINDRFGHAAGDEVLKAVVAELQRHIRASDVVGRLGGDEFVLLLWNLTEADALAKAALLEDTIDGLHFTFKGCITSAGASAGVALLDRTADATAALEQADLAMYTRKQQRKALRAVSQGLNPVPDPVPLSPEGTKTISKV